MFACKRANVAVFLGITLIVFSLLPVVASVMPSTQMSVYRFDAKGGIPGPPDKNPKPPDDVAVEYELFIEIDYMVGHEPNSTVLEYVHSYYLERGINVTFYLDDSVPLDSSISDTDFWNIEAAYNDLGDDKYGLGDEIFGTDGVYSSKWKWVLYGTNVENEPNVVGYTYPIISIKYNPRTGRIRSIDSLAGNYIFIADGAGDSWALNRGIESSGAEAVVLMHEFGHGIGITRIGWSGNIYNGLALWEIYDPDPSSVMSLLSTTNAVLIGAWYYSTQYWKLKNINYYTI